MEPEFITIKGAAEHNLAGIDLKLPRNRLICFTGVSGSGKSSLAFDTLHAEGQRRYIESLSAYARQFLGQTPKPNVEQITGLSPTVAIQQKTGGWNPRSTVATITQIHDYLRVLFARVGTQHCTRCDQPISAQTREQIASRILALEMNQKILILAPIVRGQKGEFRDLFQDLLRRGFSRARVDGRIVSLADDPNLRRNVRHHIELVVDRLHVGKASETRLSEAIENALNFGEGTLVIHRMDDEQPAKKPKRDWLLSSRYACPQCALSFEPPSPQLFSFNSPTGMCLTCDGIGTRFDFDIDLLVPDPRKSFLNLAIEPMRVRVGKWRRHFFESVAKHLGIKLSTPWKDLPEQARHALLHGTGDTHLTFEWKWSGGVWKHGGTFDGVIHELHDKHRKAKSSFVRAYYEKYMRTTTCPACQGARLNPQALAVKLNNRSIQDCLAMSIADSAQHFRKLKLDATQTIIARDVLKEITSRLQFLIDVGLHYLSLDRTAPTLSGGESQRIRLASQIGSGLTGVLYVLDEPSIGLHARDNRRLLEALQRLRDMGNTVIVVEHDEDTMRAADIIVDFGPGPGVRGGHVVAQGDLNTIRKCPRSLTAKYLSGEETIEIPQRRAVGHMPKRNRSKRRKFVGRSN